MEQRAATLASRLLLLTADRSRVNEQVVCELLSLSSVLLIKVQPIDVQQCC